MIGRLVILGMWAAITSLAHQTPAFIGVSPPDHLRLYPPAKLNPHIFNQRISLPLERANQFPGIQPRLSPPSRTAIQPSVVLPPQAAIQSSLPPPSRSAIQPDISPHVHRSSLNNQNNKLLLNVAFDSPPGQVYPSQTKQPIWRVPKLVDQYQPVQLKPSSFNRDIEYQLKKTPESPLILLNPSHIKQRIQHLQFIASQTPTDQLQSSPFNYSIDRSATQYVPLPTVQSSHSIFRHPVTPEADMNLQHRSAQPVPYPSVQPNPLTPIPPTPPLDAYPLPLPISEATLTQQVLSNPPSLTFQIPGITYLQENLVRYRRAPPAPTTTAAITGIDLIMEKQSGTQILFQGTRGNFQVQYKVLQSVVVAKYIDLLRNISQDVVFCSRSKVNVQDTEISVKSEYGEWVVQLFGRGKFISPFYKLNNPRGAGILFTIEASTLPIGIFATENLGNGLNGYVFYLHNRQVLQKFLLPFGSNIVVKDTTFYLKYKNSNEKGSPPSPASTTISITKQRTGIDIIMDTVSGASILLQGTRGDFQVEYKVKGGVTVAKYIDLLKHISQDITIPQGSHINVKDSEVNVKALTGEWVTQLFGPAAHPARSNKLVRPRGAGILFTIETSTLPFGIYATDNFDNSLKGYVFDLDNRRVLHKFLLPLGSNVVVKDAEIYLNLKTSSKRVFPPPPGTAAVLTSITTSKADIDSVMERQSGASILFQGIRGDFQVEYKAERRVIIVKYIDLLKNMSRDVTLLSGGQVNVKDGEVAVKSLTGVWVQKLFGPLDFSSSFYKLIRPKGDRILFTIETSALPLGIYATDNFDMTMNGYLFDLDSRQELKEFRLPFGSNVVVTEKGIDLHIENEIQTLFSPPYPALRRI